MIAQLRQNLGHPSPERLCQALQQKGARSELVQGVADYRCSICAKTQKPKRAQAGHLRPAIDLNHRVMIDGIQWKGHQGQEYHFYHVLDLGTNYHVAFHTAQRSSSQFLEGFMKHWIQWAGAPDMITFDSATEFNSEEAVRLTERFGIRTITTVPHAPNGRIERRGAFLQQMLARMDLQEPINTVSELDRCLGQCTASKNSLSLHRGYSPEMLVFGKPHWVPGSVLSDNSLPSHAWQSEEQQDLQTDRFRSMLRRREQA